jgi:hypothetical protein
MECLQDRIFHMKCDHTIIIIFVVIVVIWFLLCYFLLYWDYIHVITELKPDFIRKLQDFEVKERESAVLEVEISSETADVTWHKVING